MCSNTDSDSLFGPVLFCYSRQQAIEDGVLVDASAIAKEAGFKWPVALTETLYHSYIVPALDLIAEGQSITSRLWDVLNVLHYTISKAKDTTFLQFSVLLVMTPGASPVSIELTSVAGPGDDGEPVITIMLPDED
jgi:hypothetical protein